MAFFFKKKNKLKKQFFIFKLKFRGYESYFILKKIIKHLIICINKKNHSKLNAFLKPIILV